MRFLIVLIALGFCFSNTTYAKAIPYYGSEFYSLLPQLKDKPIKLERTNKQATAVSDSQIKEILFQALSYPHKKVRGGFDEIARQCNGSGCYRHKKYSYKQARRFMMGDLYLKGNKPSNYSIEGFYCLKDLDRDDFSSRPPGPDQIPHSNVVNTEHLWPQSRFNRRMPKSFQKSDLHSLRPTLSRVNSLRGNLPFGEVDKITSAHCDTAVKGKIDGQPGHYFEPPDIHKGNVARSLFYFSVRYKIKIDKVQEAYLRKWDKQDPIDSEEIALHEAVFDFQNNRNPFIDHPELIDMISDL